jgi:uncharacterized membrane protein YeaQ/YmgE (transglycosylase-associated protein family)
MFPISPVVMLMSLVVYALAGMAIGALTGWLASLIMKCGQKGLLKDGFLGSFGYLAGFIGSIFVPWPRNTITYRLEGGTEVSVNDELISTPRAGCYRHCYPLAPFARTVSMEKAQGYTVDVIC